MKIQFQDSSVPSASSNSRELPLQSTENPQPQWGMLLTRIKEFLSPNQLINQRQKVAVEISLSISIDVKFVKPYTS